MIYFFLLITKHYFVDFYLQTPEMVRHKGIYGDQIGLEHSIEWFSSIEHTWSCSTIQEGKLYTCNEYCGIK